MKPLWLNHNLEYLLVVYDHGQYGFAGDILGFKINEPYLDTTTQSSHPSKLNDLQNHAP
jgi:hypothetical protein